MHSGHLAAEISLSSCSAPNPKSCFICYLAKQENNCFCIRKGGDALLFMTGSRADLPLLQCRNGSYWNARKVLSRSFSAPGGPPSLDNESSCSPPFVMHFTPTGHIVRWVFLNRCIYLQVKSSPLEFNTSAHTPVERVLSVLCLLFPLFEDPWSHLNDCTTCSCRLLVWNVPSGPFTFSESGVTGAVLSVLIYCNLVSFMKYLLHEVYAVLYSG